MPTFTVIYRQADGRAHETRVPASDERKAVSNVLRMIPGATTAWTPKEGQRGA